MTPKQKAGRRPGLRIRCALQLLGGARRARSEERRQLADVGLRGVAGIGTLARCTLAEIAAAAALAVAAARASPSSPVAPCGAACCWPPSSSSALATGVAWITTVSPESDSAGAGCPPCWGCWFWLVLRRRLDRRGSGEAKRSLIGGKSSSSDCCWSAGTCWPNWSNRFCGCAASDDAEVVLGVLQVVLGHHRVAGTTAHRARAAGISRRYGRRCRAPSRRGRCSRNSGTAG